MLNEQIFRFFAFTGQLRRQINHLLSELLAVNTYLWDSCVYDHTGKNWFIGTTSTEKYKDPDLSGSSTKSWQEAQITPYSRGIVVSVTNEFLE